MGVVLGVGLCNEIGVKARMREELLNTRMVVRG